MELRQRRLQARPRRLGLDCRVLLLLRMPQRRKPAVLLLRCSLAALHRQS